MGRASRGHSFDNNKYDEQHNERRAGRARRRRDPVLRVPDYLGLLGDPDRHRGSVYGATLIARNGDLATYRNGDGCEWTDIYWGFAPTLSWRGCPGAGDGSNKITEVTGEIWPLEAGKAVSYDYSGVDQGGNPWQAAWRCEVEAQERITVVSGEYDTIKVVCENPWAKSTTHVAPRVNNVVAIVRTQKDQNQTSRWKMVRFEPAKPSS